LRSLETLRNQFSPQYLLWMWRHYVNLSQCFNHSH
jgi:hypothetical protein